MSTSPGEQVGPEADLLPADHANVITEVNWQEMKAKGVQMLKDQVDLSTAEGQESLKGWQDTYGPEYIYTGAAFEWHERRPLDHKPGRGIYTTREGVRRYVDEGYAADRQSSTGDPSTR